MSKLWHNCSFCVNYLFSDQLSEAQWHFLEVTLSFQWPPPVDVHMDVHCGSTGVWLTLFPIPLCPKQVSKSLWATQEKATHAIPIQPTSSGHEPLFDSVLYLCATHLVYEQLCEIPKLFIIKHQALENPFLI